jgi:hypothetical protein
VGKTGLIIGPIGILFMVIITIIVIIIIINMLLPVQQNSFTYIKVLLVQTDCGLKSLKPYNVKP